MCVLKGCVRGYLQGVTGTCGIAKEGGKENVDPGAKPTLPRRPRAKKGAAEDLDPTHCTQIPSLKRTLKRAQRQPCAEGVETQQRTPRTARSKKEVTAAVEVVDFLVQTPMPGTRDGNDFGPPPPESTPAPQRESHISRYSPPFCILEAPLSVCLSLDPDCYCWLLVQVVRGLQVLDEQGRRKGRWCDRSRDVRVLGCPHQPCLTLRMEFTRGR